MPPTDLSAEHCPVSALLPELADILTRMSEINRRIPTAADLALGDILGPRQRALEAMAETSRAQSLEGAAFQSLLSIKLARDIGSADGADGLYGDGNRYIWDLTRTIELAAQSTFRVMAAHGGALPAVIIDAYFPAEIDTWAALSKAA